jgi:pimeloyl-ACP methyl ester carboxylesterase
MARDVIALLDNLQIETAHLVGMSMGGMIAQTLAIHFPERVRTLTSQSSTPWSFDPGLGRPTPEAQEVLVKPIPTDRDRFVEASVRAWQVIGGPHMPAGESLLRRRAERFHERGVCLPGLARQMAAIIASGSRRETLRGIRIPTLVLHGDADPLVPPDHARAPSEAVSAARRQFVKGVGPRSPPRPGTS